MLTDDTLDGLTDAGEAELTDTDETDSPGDGLLGDALAAALREEADDGGATEEADELITIDEKADDGAELDADGDLDELTDDGTILETEGGTDEAELGLLDDETTNDDDTDGATDAGETETDGAGDMEIGETLTGDPLLDEPMGMHGRLNTSIHPKSCGLPSGVTKSGAGAGIVPGGHENGDVADDEDASDEESVEDDKTELAEGGALGKELTIAEEDKADETVTLDEDGLTELDGTLAGDSDLLDIELDGSKLAEAEDKLADETLEDGSEDLADDELADEDDDNDELTRVLNTLC